MLNERKGKNQEGNSIKMCLYELLQKIRKQTKNQKNHNFPKKSYKSSKE